MDTILATFYYPEDLISHRAETLSIAPARSTPKATNASKNPQIQGLEGLAHVLTTSPNTPNVPPNQIESGIKNLPSHHVRGREDIGIQSPGSGLSLSQKKRKRKTDGIFPEESLMDKKGRHSREKEAKKK